MDGAAKKRRINSIRCQLPHCTQSALAAFCKLAKYTELPDITQPREIREARDYVAASETPYGPLLHMLELITVQNTTIQLEVANPLALLYIAAKDLLVVNCFRQLMRNTLVVSTALGSSAFMKMKLNQAIR